MIDKIKEAMRNDSLILFVGAGMSIPFGFPNWTKLIQNILVQLKEESSGNSPINFQFYIDQGNSIDVFEVLHILENNKYASRVKEILFEEINKVKIKGKDFIKQEKLWQISDKIITTNYDKVLEEKMPEEINAFRNLNEFQQSKSLKGGSFLYKIHGDVINPDTCILFESDYKRIYNSNNTGRETLKSFLQTKTLLFIGFSFEDPFIQKQLDYLCQLYKGYNQRHYIVLTNNKDLRDYNVETILIKNWNDSLDDFLDELRSIKENSNREIISKKIKEDNIDISKSEDLVFLQKLFDDKLEEYKKESDFNKKKISKEVYKIRNRILELQTIKLDLDFNLNIPIHKDEKLEHLFDAIYNSEKLSSQVILDIQKVREQHSQKHEWYHRSVS